MTWVAPVVLAGLVMLPRLASPQFGLLDDGLTLQTGRQVVGHWSRALHLVPETGRFVPAYWLAYSAVFGVVGVRPLGFFLVNAVILAGLLAMLGRLVRAGGGTSLQAAGAMAVFALCGPTIESFYTLSKPEPLQLVWMAGALLATIAAARTHARWPGRAGLMALAAGASLLACATKETGVVLVAIAVGWLAIEWWPGGGRGAARFAALSAVANGLAALAFGALRTHYAPLGLGEGSYTRAYALDPDVMAPALFRIVAWLVRDFAFLVPLLLFTVASGVGRRRWSGRPIGYAGVWMAGWLAVFLPWPATFEYYLLPFAFGVAAAAGFVLGDCWAARRPPHPIATRRLAWGVLAAGGGLWLVTVVNATADARVQLTVDRANTALVAFLARLPPHSRVVLNTATNEYHAELPMHLAEIRARSDLAVEPVSRMPPDGPVPVDVVLVTPEVANRPWPTVRVALDEASVRRDHAALARLLGGPVAPVYRDVQQAWITEIGLHRLLCPRAPSVALDPTFCPGDRLVLDRRLFSYGWQVHRRARPPSDREPSRHGG